MKTLCIGQATLSRLELGESVEIDGVCLIAADDLLAEPRNVEHLGVVTRFNIPPSRVLRRAIPEIGDGVVVMGYDHDGDEYFASSYADGSDVLWLLERAKLKLLRIVSDDAEEDVSA